MTTGARTRILLAVVVALVVGVGTWFAAVSAPAQYEARVDLLAAPLPTADPAVSDLFPAVAANSLPAVIDVTRSPSVLAHAAESVAGAPPPGELAAQVVVDVIPQSLLTRITVRAPTPAAAGGLVTVIADGVIDRDLLAPVGRLRVVDADPVVRQIAPDRLFAAGLAMTAGAATGAALLTLAALVRPTRRRRLDTVLAAAGITRPVAIVDSRSPSATADLAVLVRASGRRARVVALQTGAQRDAERLSEVLAESGMDMAPAADGAAVVGVVCGTVSGAAARAVSEVLAALPEGDQLIALAHG